MRSLKRFVFVFFGLLLAFGALIGIEVVLALRRDYLPTTPALEIEGTFGDVDAPPLRFVVLGDSTAAGVGAGGVDDAYATRLARAIAQERYRVTLTGVGVSGARIADVLEDQLPRALDAEPDIVFVGIGANDVTHLTRLGDVEDSTRTLLERLKETGAVVVLAGPPDMRAAAFLEPLRSLAGWRGDAVARRMEAVAREEGVPFVPLAERTRDFFAEDPERYYSDDDFHPSAAGYGAWADAIFPYLEEALP